MAEVEINDFINRLVGSFVPEKAVGLDATIQFNLTGEHAMQGYMVIKDGQCSLAQGLAPQARLTVTAKSEDLMDIFTGKLDGMQAFMQGKLKIAGDMSLAMKLLTMFKMQ